MRSRSKALPILLIVLSAWPPAVFPEGTPEPVTPLPFCDLDQSLCDEYRALETETATPPADQDAVAALFAQYRALESHQVAVVAKMNFADDRAKQKYSTETFGPQFDALKFKLNALSLNLAPDDANKLKEVLSDLDHRVAALERGNLQITRQRIDQLNGEGTVVWEHIRQLAENIGNSGAPLHEQGASRDHYKHTYAITPAGALTMSEINPLQERIADLARRLRALSSNLPNAQGAAASREVDGAVTASELGKKGLLNDPFGTKPMPSTQQAPVANGSRSVVNGGNLVNLTVDHATLLDMNLVPRPPAQVQYEAPGFFEGWLERLGIKDGPLPRIRYNKDEDLSGSTVKLTKQLRAEGDTVIYGDPARRAKFIVRQTGGTCTLASQVQLMADAGVIPTDKASLKQKEDELYRRAVERGYFTGRYTGEELRKKGGTMNQFTGDLMDMPVSKHFGAAEEELLAAAKTGKMLLVSVDSKLLWGQVGPPGGHTITITGLEVEKEEGVPLGFYVNDTGAGEGGRFVPAVQFLEAWKSAGGVYVAPL